MNARTVVSIAVLGSLAATAAVAQTSTVRVSVDSSGGEGAQPCFVAFLSFDGRYAAFDSGSALVASDTNGNMDCYVRDSQSGVTERVSVSTSGQGSGGSYWPSISADGRWIAFDSFAMNLVAGDTNNVQDVFVRDRQNSTTVRISLSSAGAQANARSERPSISYDGRFVAFSSLASNLVPNDTNGFDVFVRDLQAGTTVRVSVDSAGQQGNGDSDRVEISGDGRFVAFRSAASNLVAGDTNGVEDLFVRDLVLGTTERASVGDAGQQPNASTESGSISANGRFVAFACYASNLVANAGAGVFVRDRLNGTTEIASLSSTGAPVGANQFHGISADGRFVAFWTFSPNVVPGDTNSALDVFVRDRVIGSTERMSVDSAGGQGGWNSYGGEISGSGRCVAFVSEATNLVAGDTNGVTDVFVRDRGPVSPGVYCTGGTTSNGCVASISASANPSVTLSNACNITVANVEGQRTGIVFYGLVSTAHPRCALGGSSWTCVASPIVRTGAQNSGGAGGSCNGSLALDWTAFQASHPGSLGSPWNAGATADVQAWFRDPLACKASNLSNAVELTYQP